MALFHFPSLHTIISPWKMSCVVCIGPTLHLERTMGSTISRQGKWNAPPQGLVSLVTLYWTQTYPLKRHKNIPLKCQIQYMKQKSMQTLSSCSIFAVIKMVLNDLKEALNRTKCNPAHQRFGQINTNRLTTPGKIFLSLSTAARAFDFPPERQSSNS